MSAERDDKYHMKSTLEPAPFSIKRKIAVCLRAPAATRTSSIIRLLLVLRFEAEQFGTVLIGRSGQQPLGLDAGLA